MKTGTRVVYKGEYVGTIVDVEADGKFSVRITSKRAGDSVLPIAFAMNVIASADQLEEVLLEPTAPAPATSSPPPKIATTYLSCAETAKLVRVALKKNFPGVKFSVRSDNNSIRVGWVDGPTRSMVDAIAKQYQGGGFDGMIDMQYSRTSWLLPDGSAVTATCEGTAGSRGTVPPSRNWMPDPGAKLVQFGSTYVFCERRYTAAFLQRRVEKLGAKYGVDVSAAKITESSFGAYLEREPRIPLFKSGGGVNDGYLETELMREAYKVAADIQR